MEKFMKELRLNFEDYTAEQQEKDAALNSREKPVLPFEVYVMRVNGEWSGVMPRAKHNIIFSPDNGVELKDFVEDVQEDLAELGIKPRFRCVNNFGIAKEILKAKMIEKLKNIK
jgi:hypothetical protein